MKIRQGDIQILRSIFGTTLFLLGSLFSIGQDNFYTYDSLFSESMKTDFDLAKTYLDKQTDYLTHDTVRADYYQNVAVFYYKQNELDSFDLYTNKTESYLVAGDDRRFTNLFRFRALAERKRLDFSGSNQIIFDAIAEGRVMKNTSKAYLYNIVSGNLISQSKFDSAEVVCHQMNQWLEDADTKLLIKLRVFNLFSLGNIKQYQGKYDSAIYYYEMGGPFIEPDDLSTKAEHSNLIANILNLKEDYAKAIIYYKRGIEVLEQTTNQISLVHGYFNIAESYKHSEILDTALIFYQKGYHLSEQLNYPLIRAHSLLGIAEWYYINGQMDSAIHYSELSLKDSEAIDNIRGFAFAYSILANTYAKQDKRNLAIEYARQAYQGFLSESTLEAERNAYETMVDVFEILGPSDSTLKYYKKLQVVIDSVRSVQVQTNIGEVEVAYATRLKEAENKQLKLQVEQEEQATRFWTFIAILGAILLVTISVAFFFLSQNRKQKLRVKEKELIQAARLKSMLAENLEEARKDVVDAEQTIEALKSKQRAAEVDPSELLDRIGETGNWASFLSAFELIYPDFFGTMSNHSVDSFTKNEIRLLALIKLGLSNKEIAEQNFVSVESVKKSKNRLFKKVELPAGFTRPSDFIRSV